MSRPTRTRVLDVLGDLTVPAAVDLLHALAEVLDGPDARDPATQLRVLHGGKSRKVAS